MRRLGSRIGTLALSFGVIAALALVDGRPAHAQSMAMASQGGWGTPSALTGKVVRYYYDQSGYVDAMDIDTGSGIDMVRFTADMGQQMYNAYPVGSSVTVYATMSSDSMGTSYDLVSIGATAPAPGSWLEWHPRHVGDLDLLESTPYIVAGEREVFLHGRLTRLIANHNGEVVGMILDKVYIHDPNHELAWREAPLSAQDADSDWAHDRGRIHGPVLIQVPPEFRHIDDGFNGTARVTPMFKSAPVTVVGYLEAPRIGSVSWFHARVDARAIVVNHRSVGVVGFPRFQPDTDTLFNWDIGGNTSTVEEVRAHRMGYAVYSGDMVESPGTKMNEAPAGH